VNALLEAGDSNIFAERQWIQRDVDAGDAYATSQISPFVGRCDSGGSSDATLLADTLQKPIMNAEDERDENDSVGEERREDRFDPDDVCMDVLKPLNGQDSLEAGTIVREGACRTCSLCQRHPCRRCSYCQESKPALCFHRMCCAIPDGDKAVDALGFPPRMDSHQNRQRITFADCTDQSKALANDERPHSFHERQE